MPKPGASARTGWELNLNFIRKNLTLTIIGLVLICGVAAALIIGGEDTGKKAPAVTTASACGTYRKDGVMTINNKKINVEIAYTDAEKTKGLGGRPCIQSDQGMLFDFGKDGQYAMWMKDMKFPIDIIWINSEHRIAGLWQDVEPSTYHSKNPLFENDSQHLARYVLEIKADQSKDLDATLGTAVYFQKT